MFKQNNHFGFARIVIGIAAMSLATQAQTWTYPGCPSVSDTDFTYTTLVQRGKAPDPELAEPDKMAFDMDDQGNVDVYFVEIRPGNIKRYNAATKTVKTLVKLPNWGLESDYLTVKLGVTEEGVTGIAMDPNFKTNHWVYIHWSPLPATLAVFRISRFTVTGDTILLSSEKIIMQFPAQRDECCHTGGAMAFDAYGDLWIAQGPNGGRGTNTNTGNPPVGIDEVHKYDSEEWGATNTHGMRGGFLRIHPDHSTKGYSIPAGNFGDYFFKQTGDSKYSDTSKVSPEVYIKGTRNNYSMSLDPVRRWVVWGDVGPDVMAGNVREELNLRKTPGFEGWPYFVGNNTIFSGGKDPNAPTNTSKWNTGLTLLPPARPAFKLHTLGTSPITGPIYRYDGDLQSKGKLPPHFNRKWFVTDWGSSVINVLTVDSLAEKVTTVQRIFGNHTFYGPVDFQAGPDGALYVVNYGPTLFGTGGSTSIVKIEYKGSCSPSDPKLETVPVVGIRNPGKDARADEWLVNLGSVRSLRVPNGMKGLQAFSLTGKKVWEARRLHAGEIIGLPSDLPMGALKYRWLSAAAAND